MIVATEPSCEKSEPGIALPGPPIDLRETALLLDVDGTLLDIASTPRGVEVTPGLRETLKRLMQRTGGALALVSGRMLADIDLLFAPLRLPAVGGHGAEIRYTAGAAAERPQAAGIGAELKRKLAAIAATDPGLLLEDKGYALALHYRRAPDKALFVREAVRALCEAARGEAIEVLAGKAVIEVKPAGVSKGTAVRELMRHPPFRGRRPIFIGDDVTDESAIAAMPEIGGIGISVGRLAPGAAARFEAPHDVRCWLAHLAGFAAPR